MTDEEIIKGNKLIADFMGWNMINIPYFTPPNTISRYASPDNKIHIELPLMIDDLLYHSSWDWLMPVVEKVCRRKIGDGVTYVEYPNPRTFGMLNEGDGKIMVRLNGHQLFQSDTLIESTYLAIVDFIKWDNENKL